MYSPRVSLDQWKALQAVIDFGGFAQAAQQLNRSQSSVSHAVNRLQDLLGIRLLEIKGRKAELTEAGKVIIQRSRQLVIDACHIEQLAQRLNEGWEAEIRLAVESAFPTDYLMQALKQFEQLGTSTPVRIEEVVLSGAEEALIDGRVELAISPFVPQGFLAEELIRVNFIAVAAPDHALHHLGRKLNTNDLSRETHVIVSDSGSKGIDSGWISDKRRWTVTSPESALKLISNGLGFGWLPEKEIEELLANNTLKALPLKQGRNNPAILYLVYTDTDHTGPATKELAKILKQICRQQCESND